jgi:hypothetical protein
LLPRPAGMHGMVPKRTPRGVVDESRAARPAPIKTLHASKTSTHTAKIQDLQGRLSLQLAAETFRFHSRLLGSWGLGFGRICTGRNSLIPDGWMDGWIGRAPGQISVPPTPATRSSSSVSRSMPLRPCMHGRSPSLLI